MELESLRIAFVDVTGHERFVHNMKLESVVGRSTLVIAADEGVMPQTRAFAYLPIIGSLAGPASADLMR